MEIYLYIYDNFREVNISLKVERFNTSHNGGMVDGGNETCRYGQIDFLD